MIILIIKIVFIFLGAHNPDLLEFVLLCYLLFLAYINIWILVTFHLRNRIQRTHKALS